jgi:putative ABC transport system permease protein
MLLGVLSGIYPAFILSSYKPIVVLRGPFKSGNKGVLLRKSLVVAQFIVTILLISGIIIIQSQMSYVTNKDLGYNKDPLLFLRVHGNAEVIKGYDAFKNELLTSSLISGAAVSNSLLGSLGSGGSETIDERGNILQVNTARLRVDSAFLNVYGLKLVAGENFKRGMLVDSARPVILNESAVRKIGWKDDRTAVGKPFKMGGNNGRVIAVVKDFHFSPLQQLIGPLAIYPNDGNFSRITLKTDVTRPAEVTEWVEKTWKKNFPTALLDFDFSDSVVEQQYQAEKQFARIFLCFSVLSLLIACLGLYGLIAYSTAQRTKEIGIRKVLGGTAEGIAIMLSKDLLKLVILAFAVAVPVAWYVMNGWLQDFAYRITISWWMFLSAGFVVTMIALLTVGSRAIAAAVANPVNSLRTE